MDAGDELQAYFDKPSKTNQPKLKINKIVVDAQGRTFLNDPLVIIPQLKDKRAQSQSDHSDLRVLGDAERTINEV